MKNGRDVFFFLSLVRGGETCEGKILPEKERKERERERERNLGGEDLEREVKMSREQFSSIVVPQTDTCIERVSFFQLNHLNHQTRLCK